VWVDDTVKLAGDQLPAAQEQVHVWQLRDFGEEAAHQPVLAQLLPKPVRRQGLQVNGKQQQQQQCMDGFLCCAAMEAPWAGSSSGSSTAAGRHHTQDCMRQLMHVQSGSSMSATQCLGVQQQSSKQLSLDALDSASCLQDLQDALMQLM
jgi:hypothetical protein